MIRSYRGKYAESIAQEGSPKGFPTNLIRPAFRKIQMLSSAFKLEDLKVPPGNRLEALSGDREGQHSIRINDQWRLCFRWTGTDAEDVEIVDYH
ncbi:type II toxin-antitoxin system RelE/ParE family toxin [Aureimonas pseudogalii]|uniref:Proteic killer suppression protein n=1 Tax=Aureimonas pseudogalii TaxID=1744844 RepID=A0A7W6H8Z9_9HYPH|nr:type II toxin-antitoxin system RelE/ParE family toxin [Aureimonas pseudogalii]MBB4000839.1 proteic killer suppression protein [Aureimonas pseudogalii]